MAVGLYAPAPSAQMPVQTTAKPRYKTKAKVVQTKMKPNDGAPPSRGLSGTLVGVLPWSWWSVCPGGVIDHSIGASTALFGLLILTGTL